jgi:hypothetical protein
MPRADHTTQYLSLNLASLLLLLDLQQKSSVDMWKDTTEGNGCTDEGVEFFVSANGELQVAGSDTLDLEILGSILQPLVIA